MSSQKTENGVCHWPSSAKSQTKSLGTELSDQERSTEVPLSLPCCAEFCFSKHDLSWKV